MEDDSGLVTKIYGTRNEETYVSDAPQSKELFFYLKKIPANRGTLGVQLNGNKHW